MKEKFKKIMVVFAIIAMLMQVFTPMSAFASTKKANGALNIQTQTKTTQSKTATSPLKFKAVRLPNMFTHSGVGIITYHYTITSKDIRG